MSDTDCPQVAALTEAARRALLRYGKLRDPASPNLVRRASYPPARRRDLPLLSKDVDFPRTDLAAAA